MQRYVEQIIGDLKEAKKRVPPDPKLGTEETYEEFEKKMFAIETAPSVPTKQIFGVSFDELPAPEKLSEKQMQQIIDAIVDTFEVFNIGVDFNEGIPLKLRYEILRDVFEDEVHYMPGFSSTYDFCSGDCDSCKIAEYCDIKDEIDFDSDNMEKYIKDDDELPF